MAENKEFLKKVYDKYLNSDFSYGTSNLNPKREISKEDIEDAKTLENKIIEEIERQFNEIKDATSGIFNYKEPPKTEDWVVNFSNTVSPKQQNGEDPLRMLIGGDFNIPGLPPLGEGGPLEREIRQMIFKLIPYLPGAVFSNGDIGGTGKVTIDLTQEDALKELEDAGILVLDCEGITYQELKKKKEDTDKKDNKENSEVKDNDSSEESSDDNGDEGGESSSSDGKADTASENASDNDDNASQDRDLLAACALQQLSFLQIILIIVRVISTLKKVLVMVLSILVPTLKIVARACSCWVDPPAAAEAVQLVVEKVAAIVIGLVSQILQMLWDMLNLDCLTSVVQSVLNQINQAIAGINSLSSIGSQMCMMVNGAAKEVADAKDALEQMVNDAQKKFDPKNIKESFSNTLEMSKTAFKDGLKNGFSRDKLATGLLPPGAKALAAKAKEFQTAVRALGKAAKTAEGRAASDLSKVYETIKTIGSDPNNSPAKPNVAARFG